MEIERKLRSLRLWSKLVGGFAIALLVTGLVELGLAGTAVKQEYDRIAEVEASVPAPSTYYGYQQRNNRQQAEYERSSSAFLLQGRFLPTGDGKIPPAVSVSALIAYLLAGLGFMVAAIGWVRRAHANIRDVGIRSKFGPGFAVAAYLIPVANLVLPFEAMRELHNRSHGEGEDFAHSSVDDVTGWWTAVIVGLMVFSALTIKFAVDAGTNVVVMTPLWMEFAILAFAVLLLLASAVLFARLAHTITLAQAEFLPTVEELAEPAPATRPTVRLVRA